MTRTPGTDRKEVMTVKDLGKVYRMYHRPFDRFKELLLNRKSHNEFTALKGVSFALGKGETLGIIGENGAGKSTLLQLIAGTLTPTGGTIDIQGRVLALLELGIGFHPDFTGRENVFFYGDILGYSREFIHSKYQEVLDFSELGDFIDRPLKTYSTGMQMRLAFSLISSLDPDVLIIDEALSVGDMHFQKKCIDRIIDFKNRGMTILFCSHSTYQVSILCNKAVWLKDGMMQMYGETEEVVPAYEFYQLEKDREMQESGEEVEINADCPVMIREFTLQNSIPLRRGQDLRFRLVIESLKDEIPYHVTLSIKMDNGRGVFVTGTHLSGKEPIAGWGGYIMRTHGCLTIKV
jgi:lipopolysaccharide transport system ATP-binding protein